MHAYRYRRLTAWIALAAMLLGTISSAHSGWQGSQRHDLPADICSAGGVAVAPAPSGTDGPAPVGAEHNDHCSFCFKSGAATALVDRGPVVRFRIAAAEAPPPFERIFNAGFPPRLTPPPRAPPRHA